MSLCNTLRHLLNIDVSSAHETSAHETIKIVRLRYSVPNLRFCNEKNGTTPTLMWIDAAQVRNFKNSACQTSV